MHNIDIITVQGIAYSIGSVPNKHIIHPPKIKGIPDILFQILYTSLLEFRSVEDNAHDRCLGTYGAQHEY